MVTTTEVTDAMFRRHPGNVTFDRQSVMAALIRGLMFSSSRMKRLT
jgi:hypothetical protein